MNFAILKNDESDSHELWVNACKDLNVKFQVIDLSKEDWLSHLRNDNFNCCLLRPPCKIYKFIELYKQRVRIINNFLKIPIFPSLKQVELYEDKRYLAYFLMAQKIPHPETKIFYYKKEALQYINKSRFPIVAKTSHGAGGTGVVVLKNLDDATKYVNRAFSKTGIKLNIGPNRVAGNLGTWIKKAKNVHYLFRKLKEYKDIYDDPQRGFVIFQEYIDHEYEWRIINIGGSFFGYKKMKIEEKASGAHKFEFSNPPSELLSFTRNICRKEEFDSMAFDIFVDSKRGYLVNELQTIFGQKSRNILWVNGRAGRYIYSDRNTWIFEEGEFNKNKSYNLRLEHVLKLLEKTGNG